MKPYYSHAGITLFHGSVLDVLPQLEASAFDCAIADPCYGETSLKWDKRVVGWMQLVRPLLSPAGSVWCFGSMRMFLETASEFIGWKFAQDLVWEKQNGSGFQADRFKRVHEAVAHWYPADSTWEQIYKSPVKTLDAVARQVQRKMRPKHMGEVEGHSFVAHDGGPRLMRSVIRVKNCHGEAVHPTQKPLGIVKPPLSFSTPPGGRVLSIFTGSGTDLVAAKELGLEAVGIEIDEAWCEEAAQRLSQEVLPLGAMGGA